MLRISAVGAFALCVALPLPALAEVSEATLKSLATPDKRRDAHRHAEVQGRRADAGDGARRSTTRWISPTRSTRSSTASGGPPPTRSARASTSIGAEDNDGRHFLRPDGREVAVPHGQCRHDLLPLRWWTSPKGPMVIETAAEGARHHQRHVVPAGSSTSASRARPRRRRQVPDRAARAMTARCRTAAFSSRARKTEPCALRRARVPDRQRSEADRRD